MILQNNYHKEKPDNRKLTYPSGFVLNLSSSAFGAFGTAPVRKKTNINPCHAE